VAVLRTGVHAQLSQHGAAKRVAWEHALDRMGNYSVRCLSEQLLQVDGLEVADIARMAVIHLVLKLVPSYPYLFRIDDDYVVARIHVGCVLCSPRSRRASSEASLPRVLPCASTRYHSRWTSAGLVLTVVIIPSLRDVLSNLYHDTRIKRAPNLPLPLREDQVREAIVAPATIIDRGIACGRHHRWNLAKGVNGTESYSALQYWASMSFGVACSGRDAK